MARYVSQRCFQWNSLIREPRGTSSLSRLTTISNQNLDDRRLDFFDANDLAVQMRFSKQAMLAPSWFVETAVNRARLEHGACS